MSTEGKTPEQVKADAPEGDTTKTNAPAPDAPKADESAPATPATDTPTVPTKADTADGKLEVKSHPAATRRTRTPAPAADEPDRFADVRALAETNHNADLARTEKLRAESEGDGNDVTELPATDKSESRNPEQVKSSSKFPEAK